MSDQAALHRVFRIVSEAVGTDDDEKHRAMTFRALLELAAVITIGDKK